LSEKIFEVRFHGRGGQGAWTASLLLAQAGLKEGKNIQSFPAFGPERAGAPITAFTRICDIPIQIHSAVYEPDVVVVLDPTLLGNSVADGVQPHTKIIVNYSDEITEIRDKLDLSIGEVWTVDATDLAMKTLGRPITNTAMLGAFVKATELVGLESIITVVKDRFEGKLGELNGDVVRTAYKEAVKE
jgi:2-oxoacid:acceptor oxidoreductase gamma subunit (pyruvate/2-ketoisovalerate family)